MGRTDYLADGRGPNLLIRAVRTGFATTVAVAALVCTAPSALAATLAQRLDAALATAGIPRSQTGVLALDLRTGGTVYRRNAGAALRPASNEKLTVALAALDRLGTGFRIDTDVLGSGRPSGRVWLGDIVLKGHGDPRLSRSDLARLATAVRAAGIARVTGGVVGDESYFDRVRTAPGWKRSYYKEECPPLSALVVDRAYFHGRMVDNPALAAAKKFRSALLNAGVRVAKGARVGRATATAVPLATMLSPSLADIVRGMDQASDNFYAEMLLKELGARLRGRGTTYSGTRVIGAVLRERGVPLSGVRIVDGSGLSLYDRLTAKTIVALLVSAWSDAKIHNAFVGSLAVAGVSGTLEDRMRRPPARGVVRAKTGTTARASALSGYVGRGYVFAILQNGNPVPFYYARKSQDRFAQILAGAL